MGEWYIQHEWYTLDRGMICLLDRIGLDSARFHYAPQNSVQLKTCGLFLLEFSI
jgi:hypothetical protein